MVFALWITGPPASGKSTLTKLVITELRNQGIRVEALESDKLRRVLTPTPDYISKERRYFYRAMSYIGSLLVKNGVSVIFDATAHREEYRQYAKRLIPDLLIVYVSCSLETRRRRDKKGLYERAAREQVKRLPGLQVEYEPPTNPNLTVNTDKLTPKIAARSVMALLGKRLSTSNRRREESARRYRF